MTNKFKIKWNCQNIKVGQFNVICLLSVIKNIHAFLKKSSSQLKMSCDSNYLWLSFQLVKSFNKMSLCAALSNKISSRAFEKNWNWNTDNSFVRTLNWKPWGGCKVYASAHLKQLE